MSRRADEIGIPLEPTWEKGVGTEEVNGGTAVLKIGNKKQLFLDDDFLVSSATKVRKVMNRPRKYPDNPIIVADKAWEKGFGIDGGTVMHDEGVWKMWYRPVADASNAAVPMAYALSEDGIHWRKPVQRKIEFEGSRENNLILGASLFDGWKSHGAKVIKDSPEREKDPEKLYKMFISLLRTEPRSWGFAVAFSPDGLNWILHPEPVVEDYKKHYGGYNTAFYDSMLGRYVAYFQRRPRMHFKTPMHPTEQRYAGRMESEDFIHWTDSNYLALGPDQNDPPDSDLFEPEPFQYNEAAYAYFNTALWFDYLTDKIWVRLAMSRDNLIWRWAGNRRPFIPLGEPGEWDSMVIHPVFTPAVAKDDEIYLYYAAFGKFGLVEGKLSRLPRPRDMELAKMRLDGFISLEAGHQWGSITTWPVKFSGSALELNADASRVVGEKFNYGVRVEILDEVGRVIPGYSRDECDPVTVDNVRCRATWNGKADLGKLESRTVRLKFYLRFARLYAFQFK